MKTVFACVAGGSYNASAVSAAASSKTANLSPAENKPSEGDDSFFSTWLASPSQQQDASRSPSASRSPLAPKHQLSSRQVPSASLTASTSLSRTVRSDTAIRDPYGSEKNLFSVSGSEQSAVVKSDKKETSYCQFQPISVSISDDRQAEPENTDVAGLLISTSDDDVAKLSSSEHSEVKFDANEALDTGSFSDVRKSDVAETSVALFVSGSNEDGADGSVDDDRMMLAAEANPTLDMSASSNHFNSQLSSSILSPEPDELLGMDGDIQPEGSWNDNDLFLSSTVDLPEMESADISMETATTKLADHPDNDVDIRCDEPTDTVDSVDRGIQSSDKEEAPTNIPEDTSSTLSAEADIKVVKESPSLEGSMKEVSSLEGSLEASADELSELSEGNKTVIAEDSDVYCDDMDVDEMQMSGSTRSGIQQEHSTTILSSSADSSETVGKECCESSGTDGTYQLEQSSSVHGDDHSETGEVTPPGSSFVKNLLEEAMADNSTRDSSGSAEPARIESGGNSGHTSADEIDTTTSSDIEIISHTSSMNGRAASTHGSRPVDISPRHGGAWNSRTQYNVVGGQHRRSDSGSSAQSLQSRTDDDFASPDVDHGRDYLSRSSRDARRHFAKSDPG